MAHATQVPTIILRRRETCHVSTACTKRHLTYAELQRRGGPGLQRCRDAAGLTQRSPNGKLPSIAGPPLQHAGNTAHS